MHNKETIYETLKAIFADLFDVDPSQITPESKLYEDLDIDSIDAVDLIVRLKELTGKKLQPADFKQVRTVQDIVDAVSTLLNEESEVA